jgi:hypothetical protein
MASRPIVYTESQKQTIAFLQSKGNTVPEGARMAGNWIAPNAPSGNVISYRVGNTFHLFDKESGKPFATVDVPANATISSIAGAIKQAAGNTTQYQQKQREQEIKSAGYAPDSLEAKFLKAFPMNPNKLADYDLTVDQKGNVVAISKSFGSAMFADLGQSKDVIVINPTTNEIVSQGQKFEEELVWDPYSTSWKKASLAAQIRAQKEAEAMDEYDRRNGLVVGTTRGMKNFMDGLVTVVDGLATAASFIGVPTFVVDIYKAFAPPGSKYYKEGTIAEKFERLIKDPTFLLTLATGGVGKALANFKNLPTTIIEKGSQLDKALKGIDAVVKITNIGAKIAETAGDTIEEKVRNFAANKADQAVQGIEYVSKEKAAELSKIIEENIRAPTKPEEPKKPEEPPKPEEPAKPEDVGTTIVTEPLAPPGEPGEKLGETDVGAATGETVTTDPIPRKTFGAKITGVVESPGERNLRRFRENGNRFKAKGGAFGAQKF